MQNISRVASFPWRTIPLWVLGVAILPRLCILCLVLRSPPFLVNSDSKDYLMLASNLRQYHRFVSSDPSTGSLLPETARTPGYPFFLMPFTWSQNAVVLIALAQTILGILTVLCLWRCLARFSSGLGLVLGVCVLALDWVVLLHTPLVLAETLLTLFIVLAIEAAWLGMRDPSPGVRPALSQGLRWSLASLVKPVSLYLPLFLAFTLRYKKKVLIPFLCAAYLLPTMWVCRNWRVAGYASFSSIGPMAMIRWPIATIYAMTTGRTREEALSDLEHQLAQSFSGSRMDTGKTAYQRIAWDVIRKNPLGLLTLHVTGSLRILGGSGFELVLPFLGAKPPDPVPATLYVSGHGTFALWRAYRIFFPMTLLYLAFLGIIYSGFFVGVHRFWQCGEKSFALYLAGGALYFMLIAAHQGYYRYRIPMMPFLACGVAFAFRSSEDASSSALTPGNSLL
jgi:hypothetical protein